MDKWPMRLVFMSLVMSFRHHLAFDTEIIHVKVFWESHEPLCSRELRCGSFGVKHCLIEVSCTSTELGKGTDCLLGCICRCGSCSQRDR